MGAWDARIAAFFQETTAAFQFLESQYGYQRLEGEVQSPNDYRDLLAVMRCAGPRIGVEISWYPANEAISVSFAEAEESLVYPNRRSFAVYPDLPRAITLEALAGMQGHTDDPDFLLGFYNGSAYFSKTKQRGQLIETRLPDVLTGLARATQRYAAAILQGDTSLFPEAMAYYAATRDTY